MLLNKSNIRSIDLLPSEIQNKKSNRRLVIRLATAQVAIFLFLILAIFGLRYFDNQSHNASVYLRNSVHALRNSPDVTTSVRYRDAIRYIVEEEMFLATTMIQGFDPLWLESILYADSGLLTSIYYDGTYILVNGATYYFGDIDAFRTRLSETGIFGDIGLGNISSHGGNRFDFDFRIIPIMSYPFG